MYQTDLTETEWQYITKVLNLQKRKRKYDLRMIWNALFYLVKTGCQWRMLPLDFPKWQLVYYYYRKWAALLDFDLLLGKLRVHIMRREVKTRNQADSQMETQRFLKKVKGIKRHVVVIRMTLLLPLWS